MKTLSIAVAALVVSASLGGCSRPAPPAVEGEPAAPQVDASCVEATTEQVAAIIATFVAPIDVVNAYQSDSVEATGLTFVTVATVGFPAGVFSKTGETPIPTYAFVDGVLNTASGQAIRYSPDPAIPNISSSLTLPIGSAYDEASKETSVCAKASLG